MKTSGIIIAGMAGTAIGWFAAGAYLPDRTTEDAPDAASRQSHPPATNASDTPAALDLVKSVPGNFLADFHEVAGFLLNGFLR